MKCKRCRGGPLCPPVYQAIGCVRFVGRPIDAVLSDGRDGGRLVTAPTDGRDRRSDDLCFIWHFPRRTVEGDGLYDDDGFISFLCEVCWTIFQIVQFPTNYTRGSSRTPTPTNAFGINQTNAGNRPCLLCKCRFLLIRIENGTFAMVQLYNAAMETMGNVSGRRKKGVRGNSLHKN